MPRAEQPLSTAEIAQLVGDVLPRLIQAARAHSVNVRRLMMGLCTVVQALSSCGKLYLTMAVAQSAYAFRSACAQPHGPPGRCGCGIAVGKQRCSPSTPSVASSAAVPNTHCGGAALESMSVRFLVQSVGVAGPLVQVCVVWVVAELTVGFAPALVRAAAAIEEALLEETTVQPGEAIDCEPWSLLVFDAPLWWNAPADSQREWLESLSRWLREHASVQQVRRLHESVHNRSETHSPAWRYAIAICHS